MKEGSGQQGQFGWRGATVMLMVLKREMMCDTDIVHEPDSMSEPDRILMCELIQQASVTKPGRK